MEQNGYPKADTIQDLTSVANYNSKKRTNNLEKVQESPVWMNSMIFNVDKVTKVLKSADSMSTIPQAMTTKTRLMSYWSPVDVQMRSN